MFHVIHILYYMYGFTVVSKVGKSLNLIYKFTTTEIQVTAAYQRSLSRHGSRRFCGFTVGRDRSSRGKLTCPTW